MALRCLNKCVRFGCSPIFTAPIKRNMFNYSQGIFCNLELVFYLLVHFNTVSIPRFAAVCTPPQRQFTATIGITLQALFFVF